MSRSWPGSGAPPEEPDVCIVGGGIAAALTAYKLGRAGIRTLILEAGPRHPRELAMQRMHSFLDGNDPWRSDRPERDAYSSGGEIDYPLNETRVKAVGGSTMHWAGYTPRFLANDFRLRNRYGIAEDWPIGYDDLEPYYAEAERELGVSGAEDNPFASARSTGFPMPGFPIGYDESLMVNAGATLGLRFHSLPQARTSRAYGDRPGCVTFSACRACPIRARYSGDIHIERAEATGLVTVLPEARVVRLETDEKERRVRRALFVSASGEMHEVRARIFVLAAHAVESARLLLLSATAARPQGLANSSGLVGRYFMEHNSQHRIATLDTPLYPHRKGFATALSQQFHDHPERGEGSGFMLSGMASESRFPHQVDVLASRSGQWGEAFAEEIEQYAKEEYGRKFLLRVHAEPLPTEDNRIELDPDLKDDLGNPAPRLYYALTDYQRSAYAKGLNLISDLAEAMGAESLGPVRDHFGAHHAGTCRMGGDTGRSVVDSNLRSHDHPNLYICGSATFVTLSLVNPTLTISALALRLGDHLAARRRR